MKKVPASLFHSLSFFSVAITCGLLPFLFLPSTISAIGAVKGVIFFVGIMLATLLWLIAQFLEGSIRFPKHAVIFGLGVWSALTFIGALSSPNVSLSLWGRGFSLDAFSTTLLLSLLTFLIATYTSEQRRLVQFFLTLFISAGVTLLLQAVLFFLQGTTFVQTHLFASVGSGSIVGTWLDFGYYAVLTFLLSLLTFEVLSPKGFLKKASGAVAILSLFALACVNASFVWIIMLGATLLIFVYKSSVERSLAANDMESALEHVPFPWLTFASLLVGLFFLISSGVVGNALARLTHINTQMVRPSFSTSLQLVKETALRDPLFGVGPGRFESAWNTFYPIEINQTAFWNTPFENGYSALLTQSVSRGIPTTLLFLFLLGFALFHAFKLFAYHFKDQFGRFIAASTFILLSTTIAFFLLGTPNLVLYVFLFVYLGIFVGLGVMVHTHDMKELNFLRDPRQSFIAIFSLAILILTSAASLYSSVRRFASVVVFNRALTAQTNEQALARLSLATTLSENDIYWRAKTSLLSSLFTGEAQAQNPDKTKLQTYFTGAEQSAQNALAWESTTPANWLTLAQVYQLALGSSEGVATNAFSAITKAEALAPKNPLYLLVHAQIMLAQKDTAGALALIDRAISLKGNYLDAYLLQAQIEQAAGNDTVARDTIALYTTVAPYDPEGFAVLGITERNLKKYDAALDAFMRARALSPRTVNYTILIIQTLYTEGNTELAETEKKNAIALFPDQKEILENIRPVVAPTPVPETTTPAPEEKKR